MRAASQPEENSNFLLHDNPIRGGAALGPGRPELHRLRRYLTNLAKTWGRSLTRLATLRWATTSRRRPQGLGRRPASVLLSRRPAASRARSPGKSRERPSPWTTPTERSPPA